MRGVTWSIIGNNKSMTFNIPSDYMAPDGVKEGEEFQDIATFRFDGKKMTLLSIGEDEASVYKDGKKSKPKGAIESIKERMDEMPEEGEM
jgi:hypothetical protein